MAKRSGRASGRGSGKFKRSTGRAKSVSGRRSGKHRSVPRPSGHELVPVTCSECFEEFSFDTGVKTDSLVCPVCEHSADRPSDADLHKVSTNRKSERTNFMIAMGLGGVSGISYSAWAVLMENPANALEGGLFFGPIGVSAVTRCQKVMSAGTFSLPEM